jgi:endonuclease G, mitochondrial
MALPQVQNTDMRSVVSLVGLGLLLAASKHQEHPRPVILLVHGRGMLGRDTARTRKLWFEGLQSAAKALTREPLLDERDVHVLWYADVLDPRSTESCIYAPGDRRAARDRAEDPGLKQVVATIGNVLGLLTLAVDDSSAGEDLRGLAADASFLSDAHKRCAVESRLEHELERARSEGRPVILVAHSLGSLVAYDLLSSRSDTGLVRRFITIGSLVGSPELRHALIGGDSTDTLVVPRAVGGWVNIHNDGDLFSTPLPLGRDVPSAPPTDEPDPHEMLGYLRSPTAVREILGAWCAAFSTDRPPGCNDIRPN